MSVNQGAGVGVYYDQVGTPLYWSPEQHEGRPYKGQKCDIFAVAIILFLMATGHKPFLNSASKDDPIYGHLANHDSEAYWKTWSDFTGINPHQSLSREFIQLMESMLAYNYFERPSSNELLEKCEWVKSHSGVVEQMMKRHNYIFNTL